MSVITIIQARTTSTRLKNKVLLDIYGKSLLERVIEQSLKIKKSHEVWVATSTQHQDDLIEILCERKNVACFRGSLENVRDRYYKIAKNEKANIIVRVTADNPFTEPEFADQMISFLKKNVNKYDYLRMRKDKILDGSHTEVFTFEALENSVNNFKNDWNREHVTPAMIEFMRVFELKPANRDLICEKSYFLGVDTFSDLKKATFLFKKFGEQKTLKRLIHEINKNGKAI